MSTLSLDFPADFPDLWPPACGQSAFEHYIGQEHLLAPGKPLRRAIEAGIVIDADLQTTGTGKTTLAELMAHYCQAEVERVSMVTSGVKEIRAAIDKARDNKISVVRTLY